MKGIVVTGGEGPPPEALREIARNAGVLVAADSGLIACEAAGLKPDWIVGDMDSLETPDSGGNPASLDGLCRLKKYPPECVIRYPPEKDFTDTELAISLLREKGCDEIWLAGGGGGRTDHLFALFSLFQGKNPPDRWYTANEEIRCLKEGLSLSAALPSGSLVSLFPLRTAGGVGDNGVADKSGGTGWAAESTGLKWPLKDLTWENPGLGLSNEALTGPFEIHSIKGRFLVVMHKSH